MSFYDHLLIIGYSIIVIQIIVAIVSIKNSSYDGKSNYMHGRLAIAEIELSKANNGTKIDPHDMEKMMKLGHSIDELVKLCNTSPVFTLSGDKHDVSYSISTSRKKK